MLDRTILDQLISAHADWLRQEGHPVVLSGAFAAPPYRGSVHSCFGPADQDKCPENQDFALVWTRAKDGPGLRLVAALADGLTSSYRSDWAAELACWTGVKLLTQHYTEAMPPRQLAGAVFTSVAAALGQLCQQLTADPEASCPPEQFLSTWKYILAKGLLLQTTLTLAWLDHEMLRVALIGDGGVFLRYYQPDRADEILATCDLSTNLVQPLGPGYVGPLQEWIERPAQAPFRCALTTDGIVRGLGEKPFDLLDDVEKRCEENPARTYIENAIAQRPGDFADNLTLILLENA